MKKCFKCHIEKPLEEFYKHSRMKDGHLNKCIDCTKQDAYNRYVRKINDPEFVYAERKRGRKKYHRLYAGNGKANYKSLYKWLDRYPEKKKAHSACGHLQKPFDKAEKHHWSYNEEYYKDVIWLTKKDHMKAHRFLVYDMERMMYRRFDDNTLLDTKQKHTDFINYCIKTFED